MSGDTFKHPQDTFWTQRSLQTSTVVAMKISDIEVFELKLSLQKIVAK